MYFEIFQRSIVGWICCGPCIWMRSSTTVQKFAITTATLIVTSLLVASPVLFLISTAPSQLPKNCNVQEDSNCFPAKPAITECNELECNKIAATIQHGINSNVDPCNDFQDYGCAFIGRDGNLLQSAQERVDNQMQSIKKEPDRFIVKWFQLVIYELFDFLFYFMFFCIGFHCEMP